MSSPINMLTLLKDKVSQLKDYTKYSYPFQLKAVKLPPMNQNVICKYCDGGYGLHQFKTYRARNVLGGEPKIEILAVGKDGQILPKQPEYHEWTVVPEWIVNSFYK